MDFLSLTAEGKEVKNPVVRILGLKCEKAMIFENSYFPLRTFNVNFFPKSVQIHQSFGA